MNPTSSPSEVASQDGDSVESASDRWDSLVLQDTRVFKAGNSLAIRIPSAIAKHCGLEDGMQVEMAVDNGLIFVRRTRPRRLDDLVAGITPENLHAEEFGNITGTERW